MKILIIKLGAKGDVIRTLPILNGLKEKYPNSNITWITKSNSKELLEEVPYIDRILTIPLELNETFDILYNFDIEKDATYLAEVINAKEKYGFYKNEDYVAAFNLGAEYYLNTLFDDEIKKSNKKTYQEMMFNAAELSYKNQHCPIHLTTEDKIYGDHFIKVNNIKKRIIGIHLGASPRWPSKAWHKENLKEFIKKAKSKGYEILLFGGPDESERHNKFIQDLRSEGINILKNNPSNTDREFASLVNICETMVCGDSFALHVSLALKKPTIGLFFCTPPNEIEGYGILKKIVSPYLMDFFPEKMDQYSEELTKSISANEVLEELEKLNKPVKVVNGIIKRDDKFLVIKRRDNEIHGGKWAFPGGVVKNKEDDYEALKREIKEEVGLELVKVIKKISDYTYKRDNGKNTRGQSFFIEAKGNVKTNEEVSDYKWVTLDEFQNLDHIEELDEELMLTFDNK